MVKVLQMLNLFSTFVICWTRMRENVRLVMPAVICNQLLSKRGERGTEGEREM